MIVINSLKLSLCLLQNSVLLTLFHLLLGEECNLKHCRKLLITSSEKNSTGKALLRACATDV